MPARGRGGYSVFQVLQTTPACLRVGVDLQLPPRSSDFQLDSDVRWGHDARCVLRPFHETNRFRIEVLPEAGLPQFSWITEPIKIKVIQV